MLTLSDVVSLGRANGGNVTGCLFFCPILSIDPAFYLVREDGFGFFRYLDPRMGLLSVSPLLSFNTQGMVNASERLAAPPGWVSFKVLSPWVVEPLCLE